MEEGFQQEAKKVNIVTVLDWLIDLEYQGEIALLCCNRCKEEYACKIGNSLGYFFRVIKINGAIQQLNPGRITNGPDPSEMKVSVTLPGKEP